MNQWQDLHSNYNARRPKRAASSAQQGLARTEWTTHQHGSRQAALARATDLRLEFPFAQTSKNTGFLPSHLRGRRDVLQVCHQSLYSDRASADTDEEALGSHRKYPWSTCDYQTSEVSGARFTSTPLDLAEAAAHGVRVKGPVGLQVQLGDNNCSTHLLASA